MLQDLWNNNRMVAMLLAILVVVVPFLVYYVIEAKRKHPKGLISAALSNMGERCCYSCAQSLASAMTLQAGFMPYSISRFTFLAFLAVSLPTSCKTIKAQLWPASSSWRLVI